MSTETTPTSAGTAPVSTTSPALSASPGTERTRNARLLRRLLLGVLILVVLIGAYKLTRVGMEAWSAYRHAQQVRVYLSADDPLDQVNALHAELAAINEDVATINRELAPLMPLLRRLHGLPVYGPALAAVPALSDGGGRLLALGDEALAIMAPALAATDGDTVTRLLDTLNATGEDLAALAPQAQAAVDALMPVEAADLPPALAGKFALGQEALPLLPTLLKLSPQLPALLGFDGARTYLLLIQNNHELRATGGFITAIARITLEDGQLVDLDVVDSYRVFNRAGEYPPAPAPMQRYMEIPLMLVRDANWSPDLPTTAALIETLYQRDTGIQVDGVVTADLHALELLVQGLGSIRIEGMDQPVTSENVLAVIKEFWQNPEGEDGVAGGSNAGNRQEFNEWWRQRKDFMPAFAGAVFQRLQRGDVDPAAVLQAGLTALNERAVQAVINDPDAARTLAGLGWDGSIAPLPDADYLALVDMNMGYNKVDAVMQRALEYTVTWDEAGRPTATATVSYRHPVKVDDHTCDLTPRYGATYDDMTARCYFDYVRLYAPRGSVLIKATGLETDSISSRPGENGTEVFAGYFVLEPGDEHVISFEYRLPETLTPENYALIMQRQSGAAPLPVSIQVEESRLDTVLQSGRLEWTPSASLDAPAVTPTTP